MTIFEAVKQLELSVFCEVMYGIVKDVNTQKELKEKMQIEISEAALREGFQPLSCSG